VGAYGYELDFKVARAKRAKYFIDLSIITPYVTNTTDGKAPDLSDFEDAINKVVCKAANDAYRFMPLAGRMPLWRISAHDWE